MWEKGNLDGYRHHMNDLLLDEEPLRSTLDIDTLLERASATYISSRTISKKSKQSLHHLSRTMNQEEPHSGSQ